jgi:hypothetical protein
MLNLIKQLLDQKNFLYKKNQYKETPTTKESPCSLEIQMNLDGTVNIICSWPEFNDDNKKIMSHLANHYAMMIDALNSGFLSKDIIDTLKNHETENPMDTLFAQNVFYKIAEINFLKNHQNHDNHDALVKPSQVFHKPS